MVDSACHDTQDVCMMTSSDTERRPSSLQERVAARVRAVMAARRRTNKELAELLFLSPRAAMRRRLGELAFTLSEIERVAEWLEVDPQVLLSGVGLELELAA